MILSLIRVVEDATVVKIGLIYLALLVFHSL